MDQIRRRFSQIEQKGISVKAALSEMVGTATFVLLGCLVTTYMSFFHGTAGFMVDTAVVATAFGVGITIAMFMIAHNSGGHVNPAVSIGMVASGVISPIQCLGNVVGQLLGAILAVVLLRVLVPHHILAGGHLAANVLPGGSHILRAFLAEMVGMFIVQLVFLETGANKNSKAGALAPLAVGATYALVILAIAPVSGASLNPARSLGPALLSGYFSHLWIYLVAPVCGALLAAPVHLLSVTDIDTTLKRSHEAAEQGSGEPLLPDRAPGSTN